MSRVKRYKNQRLVVNDEDLEVEDCTVIGNGNIIGGKGIIVEGDDNTILATPISVTGKRNHILDGTESKKRTKTIHIEDDDEESSPFLDTRKLGRENASHSDDEPPEIQEGLSGIKLISMQGRTLQQLDYGDDSQLQCTVCRIYKKGVLMEPCGHASICIPCSRKVGLLYEEPKCPVCKKRITKFTAMYI